MMVPNMGVNEKHEQQMQELEAKTIDELAEALYELPPGSEEYGKIREVIRGKLGVQEKYKASIMVYPSLLHKPPKLDLTLPEVNTLYLRGVGDTQVWNEKSALIVEHTITHPFREDTTPLESSIFSFIPRSAIEYNPMFIQVVAALYITDGKNIIVLKTTDATRIKNKITLIQGHVDYNKDAYLQTESEFVKNAAIRELTEEIDFIGDEGLKLRDDIIANFPKRPRFYVRTSHNHIDIEHFGAVYEVEVPDVSRIIENIRTGEEDNHQVLAMTIKELFQAKDECDNWLNPIVKNLMNV